MFIKGCEMTHTSDLEARIAEVLNLKKAIDANCEKRGFTGLIELDYDDYTESCDIIKELTEQRAELLTALKETVRWYGLRHDFSGTPLKFIEEQKEPIQAAMRAIAKAECK